MRTQQKWEQSVRSKVIQQLPSPRLQQDLIKYPDLDPKYKLGSYYIFGETETGKTVLAAQMWLEARRLQYLNPDPSKILFISVPEFFLKLRMAIGHQDYSEDVILAHYSEAEFLVLDDLGSERSTEWVMSMLYLLINRRYEGMLTTVITSNYEYQELDEKLQDARIPSRIRRMCKLVKKTDTWSD